MIGVIKEAKMNPKLTFLVFLALTFLLLSGCDLGLTNRPTETPEPSPTPTPTETPIPTAAVTETPSLTTTPNAEATKQAEFETKKAEALKMVSIKLESRKDFATLPVLGDVVDFDSGKVQEAEHFLIDNVLPPADIKLPKDWRADISGTMNYSSMIYDMVAGRDVNTYRGVSAFFVMRDGKKMLRLGVEYGGPGQLIHFNFEDPKWWTDPVYIKTLIATFHRTDIIMFPMITYGTFNSNKLRQAGNYIIIADASSAESYSVKRALERSNQFAIDWANNRQLPDGADKTVFGVYLVVK